MLATDAENIPKTKQAKPLGSTCGDIFSIGSLNVALKNQSQRVNPNPTSVVSVTIDEVTVDPPLRTRFS